MSDTRHEQLHAIVKKLPSDFEPYGGRSRDEEWGPDCSCGCRWFLPLEGQLRFDWGICHNPASPRSGLLTFEHQGCPEFEGDEGDLDEHAVPRTESSDRTAERSLLENLHQSRAKVDGLLATTNDHWNYEDPIYRFYHQSFKVYQLQNLTEAIVSLLQSLAPERALNPWFLEVIEKGTSKQFQPDDNQQWTATTRPILEAFFHARFFLDMASRYASLNEPPKTLPSGYAALLYLYGLR